ncbi:MAG: hypothetical protein HY075_00160 [Deltaproteobacteria bacterium]|nr:hypothetical protein [Deltaproteobacteria bacterium]
MRPLRPERAPTRPSRYKKLGYGFVVITDHNRVDTAAHFTQFNDEGFLAINGEEVTEDSPSAKEPGHPRVAVHVNAICMDPGATDPAPGPHFATVKSALTSALDYVDAHPGAIAQINHPNYQWALTYDDLKDLKGGSLIEIANQHQIAHNEGDAKHPSVERLWDRLLTEGKDLYGVASDDMHALNQGHGVKWAHPGHGWVQVAASSLTAAGVRDALAAGRFYASTGVELTNVTVLGGTMALDIKPSKGAPKGYVTEFIGKGGRVLSRQQGLKPTYTVKGDEGYVRARVRGPDGKTAWVQPVRVGP